MKLPEGPALERLLAQASKTLNTSPEALKAKVASGKLDQIAAIMTPTQSKLFHQLLQNPKLAEKMMQTPKAQEMMKKYWK